MPDGDDQPTDPDAAKPGLSGDRPVVDPATDALGYAPFARHLSRSLMRMSPPEGLVTGIYAPWGAGKSSLLNFIIHYLNAEQAESKPVVVQFNPWWFSGQEDLTRRFFGQLQAALSNRPDIGKKAL